MSHANRRDFLKLSGTLALSVGALGAQQATPPGEKPRAVDKPATEKPVETVPPEKPKPAPKADPLIVGVMGTAGRGTELAQEFATLPASHVKYVCDVDERNMKAAAARVAARQEGQPDSIPQLVTDFRKMLDDKSVDVIAIAAPDHWHAPAAILAMAAGKHVYVEKPCCHNPHEGELLVAASKKHNRVVQHGTQRRSWPKNVEAIELVRSGGIGTVRLSRGWYANKRGETGRRTPAPVPPGLDWNLWQGPAPRREFTTNVVHYKWHWFWHWGTGELGNNGVHSLDVCRWGLGVDYPLSVTASGGRYHFDDDQETPDTHVVTMDFGDKGMIVWDGQSCVPHGIEGSGFGAAFYGSDGTVVIDGNGYKLYDPNRKLVKEESGSADNAGHVANFLECCRTGGTPVADAEEAYKSTLICHLGNIAYRTGRTIRLDPKTHRIAGDKEAEKLWRREYEKGWEPKV